MTETITRTCARCGAEIIGRGRTAIFCSDTCNNRAQHEKWRRRDGQGPLVKTQCENCLHLRAGFKCRVFLRRSSVRYPCAAKVTTREELAALTAALAEYERTWGG